MGATFIALVLLSIGTTGVSAAEGDCAIEVSPRAGSAGTVFIFTGTGFTPTRLILHKDDAAAGAHDLNVADDEAWEVSVRSRPGDEGVWSAELSSEECSSIAQFRVTLANTDVASEASEGAPAGLPLAAVLVLLAVGVGGGLLLGRRLEPWARDNQAL